MAKRFYKTILQPFYTPQVTDKQKNSNNLGRLAVVSTENGDLFSFLYLNGLLDMKVFYLKTWRKFVLDALREKGQVGGFARMMVS